MSERFIKIPSYYGSYVTGCNGCGENFYRIYGVQCVKCKSFLCGKCKTYCKICNNNKICNIL